MTLLVCIPYADSMTVQPLSAKIKRDSPHMGLAVGALLPSIVALVFLSGCASPDIALDETRVATKERTPVFKSPAPQGATDALRKNFSTNADAVDFGQPIQIYGVNLSGIETLDPNNVNAVDSIISPDSFWEYPLLDSKGEVLIAATVKTRLEIWESAGVTYSGHREKGPHFAPPIKEILKEHGIPVPPEIKRFRITILGLDFFYIDGRPEEQYLIPYDIYHPEDRRDLEGSGLVFLDVKNKHIYPANEIITMIANWKAKAEYANVDGDIGQQRHPLFRKSTATTGNN